MAQAEGTFFATQITQHHPLPEETNTPPHIVAP